MKNEEAAMKDKAFPLISVLMGVYNCENTLDEALESLNAQTENNWECILCDDGSADGTADVVRRWQERFPEKIIFLQNKQNRGLSVSLNRCLSKARGQFIARMDGDDRCASDRFEKEIKYLYSHPEKSIVSTDMQCFDEDGFWGYRAYPTDPEPKDLVHGVPFCHPAVMIRRSSLVNCGGYSESEINSRVEDYDLWVRMYAAGFSGANLHEPLYQYRDDRNAALRRKWKYRVNEAFVKWRAIKMLKLPLWNVIYVFRPLMLGLLPDKLRSFLHRKKLEESGNENSHPVHNS